MSGDHAAPATEPWPIAFVRTYGKAIAATAATASGYLAGAVDGGISGAEWLGLIPFVVGAAGLTAAAPYRRQLRP